jgi:hypothetical protein
MHVAQYSSEAPRLLLHPASTFAVCMHHKLARDPCIELELADRIFPFCAVLHTEQAASSCCRVSFDDLCKAICIQKGVLHV